ncbi:LysE family translocator [Marinovum sp.]|uniref:LysE family translocator n=1 Tax=Marinovum sp. TaxID=2024839 RepID=UPI002B26AA44|nr:LysE family transporter [Marinovum sp.]
MFETTLALILFLLPLAWSPGPGNLFFAAYGARFGLAATLPANAGYHLATWIVTLGLGLGFAEVSARAPGLFAVMRWAGAAYVLWLAWGLWQADAARGPAARRAGAAGGALLLLLNPKAYLIILLMFSQFIEPDRGAPGVLWIATVFTLNNLCAFLVWTLVGARIGARLRQGPAAGAVNRGLALLLAGVALWMAVAR